jgi:microcystin-dependent protein
MRRVKHIFYGVVIMVFCFMTIEARAGSVPNTFTSGSVARASDVNANFSYLADRVVPAGAVMAFAGENPPPGWLLCDGSAVSRITYPDLYAAIGNSHGSGDGATTFNVPDYRGRFLRGVDGTAGRDPDDASRTAMSAGGNTGDDVGSVQGDQLASHSHTAYARWAGVQTGTAVWTNSFWTGTGFSNNDPNVFQILPTGGSETRPKNAYVNWIIKY